MGRVILFYKPYGVLSRFTPADGNCAMTGFRLPKDVYPAGRLDVESEGLLLLVSDGKLQHRLTDPSFEHPRTYLAQVDRVPPGKKLAKLAGGLRLKDGWTRSCRVRMLPEPPSLPPRDPPVRFRKNVPTAWLELILTEGRNRQVRRMTAAIGHPTLRLVRVRIGDLTLEGLVPGAWRDAKPEEVRELRKIGVRYGPRVRSRSGEKRKRLR